MHPLQSQALHCKASNAKSCVALPILVVPCGILHAGLKQKARDDVISAASIQTLHLQTRLVRSIFRRHFLQSVYLLKLTFTECLLWPRCWAGCWGYKDKNDSPYPVRSSQSREANQYMSRQPWNNVRSTTVEVKTECCGSVKEEDLPSREGG